MPRVRQLGSGTYVRSQSNVAGGIIAVQAGGRTVARAPELRLGTEQRQPATGSGDWAIANTTGVARAIHKALDKVTLGIGASVGPDGVRGMYPSGVGHAVPVGAEQALCGKTGLYMWDGPFNPRSRVTSSCPTCKTLAASD